MTKIKNILCPVDFSKHGADALNMATQLASINQASVHLLHIIPRMNNYDFNMTTFVPYMDEWNAEAKKDSKAKMDKLVADLAGKYPAMKVSTEIKVAGDTDEAILAVATKKKSDLIVLGSHGRRGLDRVLMGSVAESVLRHAKCAVIVYKQKG